MFSLKSINAVVSATAVATALLLSAPVAYAATPHMGAGMHAFFGGSNNVKMELRNDSAQPLMIKVGEAAPMTVAPGKTVKVAGDNGAIITVAENSGSHVAGEKLGQLDKSLSGATLVVK